MTSQIDFAKTNFNKTEALYLNVNSSYSWIPTFFLWLGCISFIALSLDILRITAARYIHLTFLNAWSIVSLISTIGMICTFLYFKSKIVNPNHFLGSCLIDLWGYAIIVGSTFSIIITQFYMVYFENINLETLPTFWITTFLIATCIFITGLILENNIINFIACIYLVLSFIYFLMPKLELPFGTDIIIFYTTTLLSNFLNGIVFISLYLYLKRLIKKNG